MCPDLAQEFYNEVRAASCVVIGSHLNPDGDALGSALAVAHYLDTLGIPNEVLCHHAPPKNLQFLPGSNRVRQVPKLEKFDLGIILDLDSLERLGTTEPYFAECNRTIVVDHHVPHHSPGDLRIVDTAAPATSVILTRIFKSIGADITPDMATCLLTGIVTDTGSFRFRNTTPESLSLSALLLEAGGDINKVSEEIYQSIPVSGARLLGHMLEGMQFACNDRLCWSVLDHQDYQVTDALDEDTEGFVNELLSIDTVKIAMLVREPKPNKVRISFRSRDDYDVSEVARQFGGGGHRNAAGCTFDQPLNEVLDQLVERLKKCLESC